MKTEEPEEELNNLAPRLFRLDKKRSFEVPEHYFDSLPAIVQEKIQQQKKGIWYETLLQTFLKPQVSFVLIILVLLAYGSIYYIQKQHNSSGQRELALSLEDYKNAYSLEEIDENILIDEIDSFDEIPAEEFLNDTEIDNYLIDNSADLNQLIHEL